MDNLSREVAGRSGLPGVRFFLEDEDEFGLEDLLQVVTTQLLQYLKQQICPKASARPQSHPMHCTYAL